MARISAAGSRSGSLLTKGTKGEKIKSEKSKHSSLKADVDLGKGYFLDKLSDIELNFAKEELQSILTDIDLLGKELCDKPSQANLRLYKAKIQNFLKQAMKKIYKVDNKLGLKKLGEDQKVYVSIEQVDKELEELTMKFINEQVDSLSIIATVEGIQGLLCNVII